MFLINKTVINPRTNYLPFEQFEINFPYFSSKIPLEKKQKRIKIKRLYYILEFKLCLNKIH